MVDSTNPSMPSAEMIQQLNENIVTSELITPDNIYIDWSLLRDPYLGTVISLLINAKDQTNSFTKFNILQNKLANYQLREFDDVAYYLPELGFSTEEVNTHLGNLQYQEQIFHASPMTNFIHTLYSNINVNINHSMVKGKYTKIHIDDKHYHRKYDDICLFINTYPLQLTKKQYDLIATFLTGNLRVNVKIVTTPIEQLSLEFLLAMDEIYTNHLLKFLDNDMFSQALTAMKLQKTKFYASKRLGPVRPTTLNQRRIDAEFLRMHAVVDIMCQFTWLPSAMLGYDLHPPIP